MKHFAPEIITALIFVFKKIIRFRGGEETDVNTSKIKTMNPQPYLSQSVESRSKVEVERETRTIFSFPSCRKRKSTHNPKHDQKPMMRSWSREPEDP